MLIIKAVKGCANYYVTSEGQVWSTFKGSVLILRPRTDKKGYQEVRLYQNQKGGMKKVHRLVAEAFLPNAYNKPQVNHIDGNKANNALDNLEWASSQENITHAITSGLHNNRGVRHPRALFTETEIKAIRLRVNQGESRAKIGREFGVHRNVISHICLRKSWKHVI